MQRIAFIGLGAMGRPMARNLLRAGFEVRGFDLNPAALADLEAAGGTPAGSVREACTGADAVVLMVVNAAQAEAVLFAQGALEAVPAGAIVCLTATCPPKQVEAIAARVAAAGHRFVDCPVSGGVVGATAGSLTVMAASATIRAFWVSSASSTEPGQSSKVQRSPRNSAPATLTSTLMLRARASGALSPTLLPSRTEPLRVVAPVANSKLSSSVVLPLR